MRLVEQKEPFLIQRTECNGDFLYQSDFMGNGEFDGQFYSSEIDEVWKMFPPLPCNKTTIKNVLPILKSVAVAT